MKTKTGYCAVCVLVLAFAYPSYCDVTAFSVFAAAYPSYAGAQSSPDDVEWDNHVLVEPGERRVAELLRELEPRILVDKNHLVRNINAVIILISIRDGGLVK